MATKLKRQNFNVTPEEEALIDRLKTMLGMASEKEVFLRAVKVYEALAMRARENFLIQLVDIAGNRTELLLPELQNSHVNQWTYLVQRPDPWRRQLYVKGRKLLASTVWRDMLANNMTKEEAAENWDLPLLAIEEAISYCEANQALIAMEADEERQRLEVKGVTVEPKTTC